MTDSRRESTRRWRQKNCDKVNAYQRAYRLRNLDKARARDRRRANDEARIFNRFMFRLRQYGLTLDQYHSMVERQNFQCAVCQEEPQVVKSSARFSIDGFVIDHDHDNGRVRGLLCYRCNCAAGMVRDSAVVASLLSTYLQKHANHPALLQAA